VSTGDVEDNINSDDTDSQQQLCTSPYCKCPYHKNNGPPTPSPPPPPPTSMEGYCGEGSTQFARWDQY